MAGNFDGNLRLPRTLSVSFTRRNYATWDKRLYFSSEGRRADFTTLTQQKFLSMILTVQGPLCPRVSEMCASKTTFSFFISAISLYSTFTCVLTIKRAGGSTLYCCSLFEEGCPCFTCIYGRPDPSFLLFSANLTSVFCFPLSSLGFPSLRLQPPL